VYPNRIMKETADKCADRAHRSSTIRCRQNIQTARTCGVIYQNRKLPTTSSSLPAPMSVPNKPEPRPLWNRCRALRSKDLFRNSAGLTVVILSNPVGVVDPFMSAENSKRKRFPWNLCGYRLMVETPRKRVPNPQHHSHQADDVGQHAACGGRESLHHAGTAE